ncbi:MAG: hypothetical protein FWE95_07300 [Planctomycetaceae bacterium]|nr:hypothetical protein [Planctomycetaceae bacterium]
MSSAKTESPETLDLPNLYDKSTAQVIVAPLYDGLLYRVSGTEDTPSYKELRDCSKHPLVKLALDHLTGELEGVPWRYELNPNLPPALAEQYNGVEQWIESNVRRIRNTIITQGIRNMLIYGYSPFEAIYEYNIKNSLYEIKQLKPLLHQFTWILADQSGNFCGFEQRMPHTKPLIRLKKDESFIMSIDVEGQNWYGTSVLESTVPLWKQWCNINGQVERFFNRCVGSRVALYYPVGRSRIGEDGQGNPIEMDNAEIARQTIVAMDQNFGIALPQATSRVVDAVSSGEQAWRIEPFSDTPGNVSVFIERQKQIEELLVNSIGMPIRLFQEGKASGSRAELESFTDIAVTIMESRNHILATAIQEQIVNYLTLINFGIDNLVEIQVGNVKQSQKFFDRHPTLDPNQNQEQMDELQDEYYEEDGRPQTADGSREEEDPEYEE